MRNSVQVSVVLCAALVALGSACRQQAPTRPALDRRATRAAQVPKLAAAFVEQDAITVDGQLDESAWRETPSTDPFVNPNDGRLEPGSPVNAKAWVLWSETTLYVAFMVNDRRPTSPFSPEDLDPHVWEHSSAVELMIQPGNPGNNRYYYEIQVDVVGAIWDTRFDDYNQPITGGPDSDKKHYGHQSWSSHLRKGIRVDKQAGHYVVELAIPFASLPSPQAKVPPQKGDIWRVNLYSFRDGQRQSLAWSPTLRQGNFHKASRFGQVLFR